MGIDFAKATGSTYRVLFEQLPPTDVLTDLLTSSVTGPERSPLVDDYNRSDHRLTLFNGSVVKCGAADIWSRYSGDEYAAAWLDEPSHYSDLFNILEMVGSRLTADTGPKKQFWTLTGAGFNDAYRILEKREDEDGQGIALEIELVRASVRDNPYLAADDVKRLERQFAGTGREEQALEGGFAASTGLVYSDFSRDTHVIPHEEAVERVEDAWRAYGHDYGWSDPRVLLEAGRTRRDQLVILDEFHETGTHVEDVIKWLRLNDKPKGAIYSDHDPSDIEKFDRTRRWWGEAAEKSIDAGISEVRHRLVAREDVEPGLFVSERCEHLIREMLEYKETEVCGPGAADHAADALRYLCMGVGEKRPIQAGATGADFF